MAEFTGSKNIPCVDCDAEKQRIEESGVFVVTSCRPLDGQDNVPADERICKIEFRIRDRSDDDN